MHFLRFCNVHDLFRLRLYIPKFQFKAITPFILTVLPHPRPYYAIEGSTVTLPVCQVTGHPAAIVTWRKSSGQLPQARVRYNSRNQLQILNAQKDDSDTYFCSAVNLLGRVEKKTLLIVVSRPRFTVKPPAKVVTNAGDTVTLQCNATGDPKPVISWEMEGASLPAGRSQQIGGTLVIKDMKMSDTGRYACVATSLGVGVLNVKNVTHTDIKGKRYLIQNERHLSYIYICVPKLTSIGPKAKTLNISDKSFSGSWNLKNKLFSGVDSFKNIYLAAYLGTAAHFTPRPVDISVLCDSLSGKGLFYFINDLLKTPVY